MSQAGTHWDSSQAAPVVFCCEGILVGQMLQQILKSEINLEFKMKGLLLRKP